MLLATASLNAADQPSLAERLGYKATDKLLIVNGDDAGMCHTANLATTECMEKGFMRCATIMTPCPWFPEIVSYSKSHPEKDFGVHLTHTSEWGKYRWGSVAPSDQVPGMLDKQGYLWPEVMDVYGHAKPEEALIEGRAQIKRALAAGIDVSHIDSHMGTMQMHPAFVKAYVQLAVEFDLPIRMASQETLSKMGHPELRGEISAKGILFPDYFVYEELKDEKKQDVKTFWLGVVRKLRPGVTELYIHAGTPSDELKAITGSWQTRSQEFEVFTNDEEMKSLIAEQKITPIGYRPLRDLQRKERQQAK